MMYYKLLLIQFLSVAMCIQSAQNTDVQTFWNQLMNGNTTTEAPSNGTQKDKVHLKVYYETRCPASVEFFVVQLKPAVQRLGSHLDVHLIPYGHATTYISEGSYAFNCQHGSRECYANMVHACAIDVLQNTTHAIMFNGCLMQYTSYSSDYQHFVSVLRWCGYSENVNLFKLWKCVNSPRGPYLLKGYGDETHELAPRYVPYLLLDESTEFQDEATEYLISTVCQMLQPRPPACSNSS